ncbi:MAG: polysaccharide deacetylase family protein [Arcobacter sp.]|jgi:peptidoglycan/xylan/chitin deacetylase (PgdA/CDA1 family)|uniref:Polysaccharide deacetylase n=1 Tax=Arcobacter defluvii TaxID=873191 RepID=A0AAE7BG91_9BACT|nr:MULTISPECIES: polysaccharide deacetylase family protein [Arcobacter]MDY3200076.1 polysaccharide deacetylase family protein [Arcobacter sp.]QKF77264.1 polysaccharide deacetylase [Arcobacter defluvii]RXI33447.1 polysaccharide deacetylase [Arcobacter defluvii]BAK73145.1 polysaccharide deacetylase [Arcobacter sp. L]
MKKSSIFLTLCLLALSANSASINSSNDYEKLKQSIEKKYQNKNPKQWGENVTGVKTKLKTKDKVIALTMDACGTESGMGYDNHLIAYLEKEKIPATLFINGRWIDRNMENFKHLASNPLFEIGNHGYLHKPASVNGKSIYGISGTANISELVDEIELNARKIEELTNKRPKYFRSGTAYYDEIAVKIANNLKQEVIGFSVLGDAGATYSAKQIEEAFANVKGGEIGIIHFNHPESHTREGIIRVIEKLKEKGFKFVKLSDYSLK